MKWMNLSSTAEVIQMKRKVKKKARTKTTKKIKPISAGELMKMEEKSVFEYSGIRLSFLENLKVRKQELEEALKRLTGNETEYSEMLSADNFIELMDRAEWEMSNQIKFSLLEKKNEELEKVKHLMSRILTDEEFGSCEDCGERIPEERLLIVPETTRCVPCQSETETRDSRRSMLERSRSSNTHKKRLELEDEEESNARKIPLKLDKGTLSFMDLDELVLEDDQYNNDM
jgi:DnaK suppressor protein